MDHVERTVAFFRAIEQQDWKAVGDMLAEDFTYSGFMPDPAGKKTWLTYQEALCAAFPDWEFHLSDVHTDGAQSTATVNITGTHTGTLVLPLAGFTPIAATGQQVKLPEERATLVYNEAGQLHSLTVEKTPHGSLPGMLEQLGLE